MTLQNNLFTITSHEDGQPAFRVRLHKDWPIYNAHFPGVCIVQMVQELLQRLVGRQVCLRQAKNVKYLAIISPEEVSELSIDFTKIEEQEDGSLKVQAQVANGETIYTKLSATFR